MSKYYDIKGLKVRVSDHEPNFTMDKIRGVNDILLYTKSADNKPLNLEDQIDALLESPLAEKYNLTKIDFVEVLGGKKDYKLSKACKTIDNWLANAESNKKLIKQLITNPNYFIPPDLNRRQKERWLNYLNKKLRNEELR